MRRCAPDPEASQTIITVRGSGRGALRCGTGSSSVK